MRQPQIDAAIVVEARARKRWRNFILSKALWVCGDVVVEWLFGGLKVSRNGCCYGYCWLLAGDRGCLVSRLRDTPSSYIYPAHLEASVHWLSRA